MVLPSSIYSRLWLHSQDRIIPMSRIIEQELASRFVIEYIHSIARILHECNLVDFDVFAINQEMDDLLFNICFLGLTSLEDRSGIALDDQSYVFMHGFKNQDTKNTHYIIGEKQLHGCVDESELKTAMDQLREELSS